MPLDFHDDNSFPCREEFRLSLTMFGILRERWIARGEPALRSERSPDSPRPYFAFRTKDVNAFTGAVVSPLILWIERILGSTEIGNLPKRKQKLILLLSEVVKRSWGSGDLTRDRLLWGQSELGDAVGLSLRHILEKFKFAYFPSYVFNWSASNLSFEVENQFRDVDCIVKDRHKPLQDHKEMQEWRREISTVTDRILELIQTILDARTAAEGDDASMKLRFLTHFMAVRVMREYTINTFQRLHSSPLQFEKKEESRPQEEAAEDGTESESDYETEGDENDGLKRKRGNAGPSRKKIRTSRHQGISKLLSLTGKAIIRPMIWTASRF